MIFSPPDEPKNHRWGGASGSENIVWVTFDVFTGDTT